MLDMFFDAEFWFSIFAQKIELKVPSQIDQDHKKDIWLGKTASVSDRALLATPRGQKNL